MSVMRVLAIAAFATLTILGDSASPKHFVDCNRAELLEVAPELRALDFDSNQGSLDAILHAESKQLSDMIDKFVNVSIAEEAREMRFERATLVWGERRQKFRYLIHTQPVAESRQNPQTGFFSAGPFLRMLDTFSPDGQNKQRFKYLGRINEQERPAFALAFIAKDESKQGIVWIDETSKQILRVRVDVLTHRAGSDYDTLSTDVRFLAVNYPAMESTPWLPLIAVMHATFPKSEIHAVYRYSDYRIDGYENDTDPNQLKEDTGVPANHPEVKQDPYEQLLDGIASLEAQKPGEAVGPLREAAQSLPERPEVAFTLALALQRTHDLTGAEGQLREVVKKLPAFLPARNLLGVTLFQRGDAAGAVEQFKEAAKLDPTDPGIRANLDEAVKKLANNAAATSDTGPVTIRVDVRQVLVPAVVTDKDGHHILGLKQSDFKILEDGVEQQISGFASERADLSAAAPAAATDVAANQPSAAAAAEPKSLGGPRAYIVCVDTFHTSFGNFVHLREALQKLFQQEQTGTSQYALITLGRNMQVIQNTTKDPAKVLEAIGSAEFRKSIMQSQTSSVEHDLNMFERQVQEAFNACASRDPSCPALKESLPSQANQVGEQARLMLRQFLLQFRGVVEQIAAGKGRRTIILISDGFLMTPARPPHELLNTYFPEFPMLAGLERTQSEIEPIYRLAAKGNVPIYTIDSRGLYTSPSFDASRGGSPAAVAPNVSRVLDNLASEQGATLSEIASATGGTAFHNSNDLLTGLKRAFADGREYYMLAYVPTNSNQDGKFRKIEVQVVNKKVVVTAKRGYWATAQ